MSATNTGPSLVLSEPLSDTPTRQAGSSTGEALCFGPEATQQARNILGGQPVYLETDPSQGVADRYNRQLAYVWTPGGKLFNLDMIAAGRA